MRRASRAPLLGLVAAVGTSICVGLLFVVQKDLLGTIDPATPNWMQMVLIVLMSGTALLVRREERRFPARAVLPYLPLFGCVVFHMRNVGVALTNAMTGSAVIGTEVAMVLLLSCVVLRVRPDVWGWTGAGSPFVGAGLSLDLRLDALRFTPLGMVALLASAAAIAANAPIDADGVGEVGLGAVLVFGAWYVYYRSMKPIPMRAARAISPLIPPVTGLADWPWLGSPVSAGQTAGLVVVTIGAALVIPSLTRASRQG